MASREGDAWEGVPMECRRRRSSGLSLEESRWKGIVSDRWHERLAPAPDE